MFVDIIIFLLEASSGYITGMAADNTNLTISMEGFNSELFVWTKQVLLNASMPIATVILALFCLLDLHRQAMRMESGGSIPAELIFKVLFRFVIAKLALESILTIMQGIYNTTTYLTEQIRDTFSSSSAVTSPFDIDAIRASVEAAGLGWQIGIFLLVLLVFLVAWIGTIFANILVVVRFIEIYIYTALSPLPAATLLSEEHSQIGKSFLKQFAGICLQGTVIFLVLTFFPVLVSSLMAEAQNVEGFWAILGALSSCLLYAIALVMAIFSTGKIAKSITGAA